MSRECRKSERVVVKVQRALYGPGLPLVYDQRRLHLSNQQLPSEVTAAMGEEAKMFFWAKWDQSVRRWELSSEVAPWQSW